MAKNKGESVLAKLRNEARTRRVDVMAMINRYALERFLYRLSVSPWAGAFSLKGGLLMSAFNDGDLLRPTTDIDLNGFDENGDLRTLEEVARGLAALPVEDDGVVFDMATLKVFKDRSEGIVAGGKLRFQARIHTSVVNIDVDVGFGNAITPGCVPLELPTLLPGEAPRPTVMAYPLETTFAEKFHAMCRHGRWNTRHKDYYDIWRLSEMRPIDGTTLARAVAATFRRHGDPVPPPDAVDALSPEFAREAAAPWKAFLSKNRIEAPDHMVVLDRVRAVLLPAVAHVSAGGAPPGIWDPYLRAYAPASTEEEEPAAQCFGPR